MILPANPRIQVSVPIGGRRKPKKSGSLLRSLVEFVLFLAWLIVTGMAGYYVGYNPTAIDCPSVEKVETVVKSKCPTETINQQQKASGDEPLVVKEGGYTYDELKSMWRCSHAEADPNDVNKEIFPEDMDLSKTKWKTIMTVEPKAFFEKYLSQYPGDTRAVQPVVVFSHKPLKSFEEIPEVCKVIDVAVVPDKPGVCVAVTETYHDVASYHMLHADRQADGSFALTANSLQGRTLPDERAYAAARALLLDFFKHGEYVMNNLKDVQRYSKNRVVVGSLVETTEEMELFLNSVASGGRAGVSKTKYCVFTTSKQVHDDLLNTKIRTIYLSELAGVGLSGDANVGPKLRRYFLQAWLAFSVANSINKMMWQSPGTIWIERPDNIVNAVPIVEAVWAYTGRNDRRAAPFFASFDFFVPMGTERPVHLLHEIVLHFDLIIAWESLDAVASYRLSENNSR